MHKKDIQYFGQIYHLHLIIIVGSISLLAVLLFYLHYGSHHYHMGIDLERLELQNHCPVKYIWECSFPQDHIDRFDFLSFQTVELGKGSPVNSCILFIAICSSATSVSSSVSLSLVSVFVDAICVVHSS